MEIDDPDRRTWEQYGKENNLTPAQVNEKFGAVGVLDCGPKWQGSATLSYKANVIVTAAHMFTNTNDCSVKRSPTECKFRTVVEGRPFVSKINSDTISGLEECPDNTASHDWVVATLKTPVPKGVTPFLIDADHPVQENEKVIAVNGTNADFFSIRNKKRFFMKSIGNCVVKSVKGESHPYLFSTNCDGSVGNSGSAIVRWNGGQPQLLGIRLRGSESEDDVIKALNAPGPFKPNSGEWLEGQWTSDEIPLKPELLKAIRQKGDEVSL